jgi:hypothetical protein
MDKRWLSTRYRYADGVLHSEKRREIFFRNDSEKYISVGGAFRGKRGTIAFLCERAVQRNIHTANDAVQSTHGLYVWGKTELEAYHKLKEKFPDPQRILAELQMALNAAF